MEFDLMQWLTHNPIGELLYTLLMAMVPVVELRGAIPFGVGMLGKEWIWPVFVASVIGNLLPIPFIVIYIRRIFKWIRFHIPPLDSMIDKLEHKAHLKGRKVTKYKYLGLFIFVAIPLPGTGAWTGALAAAFLDMRLSKALPTIFAGVLAAGFLITALTYGVASLF